MSASIYKTVLSLQEEQPVVIYDALESLMDKSKDVIIYHASHWVNKGAGSVVIITSDISIVAWCHACSF